MHHKEPEQFVLMWTCGAVLLLGAYYATSMPPQNLGHNLACFLVYVWARTFEGHDVNFMDMFTIRSCHGVSHTRPPPTPTKGFNPISTRASPSPLCLRVLCTCTPPCSLP